MNNPYVHLFLCFLNLYLGLSNPGTLGNLNVFTAGFALSSALYCFIERKNEKS